LHIFDLLKSKPEQEANLLRLGVNKLGDSDKKVASRVSYLLLQVQQAHPAMKNIIVNSISELLFRPGSDYHSRYYSVITLNQTIIAHKEIDVANTLMKTYLSLFERLLAEWNNEKPVPEAEVKKVKKPRWKNKGNKGKHGGERVMAKTSEAVKEDETNKLTSAILTGMNRAYPFSELPEDLLLSHINTLYRVTHSANFNTSVQALILLFQISKKDQGLSDRFYKTLYESLLDPRLSVSSKLRLYLNLLFKAIKQDVNIERVKAFAKRLVQIADHWLNVGVVAGVLYLLIELSKSTPRLREVIFSTGGAKQLENGEEKAEEVYDGKKRDPIFANAGKTKLWELLPLLNHFHPTVELYANSLVGKPQLGENGKPMKLGQPDMSLHGLSHFLDRFVYRNPKQKTVTHGSSIMQPLAGSDATGLVLGADRSRNMKPVNINDWAKVKIENVDVGERFFYNYFMAKNKRDGAAPKKKDGAKSGDFDEDGLNEDAVWKALVSSKPDVEADDDDDLSMSDFSDLEDDDEEDVDLEDDDEEDVDLEDDEEEADADEDKPAAADDESDDNMGLDDEEGLLDSEEEISLGGDDGDEDDDAALEAMFEKELEKAGNKRALDSDDEDAEVSDAAEKPQEKPAKKKSKKQKLKDLPVFASAEDYAQFLGSSDDEDYS
jgi:ribosome biogenesis protein MAK21